jgi:DNA polymerase/3'-5' exonuclease PolX
MNEQIIAVFTKLRDLRRRQGESWKAKAYTKAIEEIKRYPKEIISGKEALNIRGVGKDLSNKIQEIINTGTVSELISSDLDKDKTLRLFESVEGVGPVTAQKWYNQGYRTLDQIPENILTQRQLVGIRLHDHLIQKIPRADIDQLKNKLHLCLDDKGIEFIIAGSYRRGRLESGDIDIIALTRPNVDVGTEIVNCLDGFYSLSVGDKKISGVAPINQIYRRIDIELTPLEEYPYTLLYFTGSGSFNVKMRGHAAQYGLTLNEKGLYDQTGKRYPASNEDEIFYMLGLQYLTPEERDNY